MNVCVWLRVTAASRQEERADRTTTAWPGAGGSMDTEEDCPDTLGHMAHLSRYLSRTAGPRRGPPGWLGPPGHPHGCGRPTGTDPTRGQSKRALRPQEPREERIGLRGKPFPDSTAQASSLLVSPPLRVLQDFTLEPS